MREPGRIRKRTEYDDDDIQGTNGDAQGNIDIHEEYGQRQHCAESEIAEPGCCIDHEYTLLKRNFRIVTRAKSPEPKGVSTTHWEHRRHSYRPSVLCQASNR